jgi:hypothetical protein
MATQTDSTNTGVLWTIVLVGSFAMIAISAAVTAMVRAQTNEVDRERPRHADLQTVVALKQTQRQDLAAAASWIDKAKGSVKVPIDVAKKLVLSEIQANPKAASPPPPPGFVMPPPTPDAAAVTAGLAAAPPGAPGAPVTPGAPATPAPPGAPAPTATP